jgi:hypothetical protein
VTLRGGSPVRKLALVGVLVGGAIVVAQVVAPSGAPTARQALPSSPDPALNPRNVPLGPRPAAYWAPVQSSVAVRPAPGRGGSIGTLSLRTPEGTPNIVLVIGRAADGAGKLWVRVRFPGRPDDADGWVPRSVLGGYTAVRTRLVVDRTTLTATLLRDGRRVFRARVAVGKPSTPTPGGRFYVRNQLHRYRSPFYGPVAFGTSGRSAEVRDWPAGGFVGIHGTNRPDLIPGRVSYGCIRLANPDIRRLARLMPVGTPVSVR